MNYSMKYMRKDYSKPTAMTDNTLYQNISKRWPMEPTVDLMDIQWVIQSSGLFSMEVTITRRLTGYTNNFR